jgi:uncharacterized protein YjiS (DUF1127 family)
MAALVHQGLTNCQAAAYSRDVTAARRRGPFAQVAATLRAWHRHAREQQELAQLSERELRDMGASSADVWREIRQPFWHATRPY